MAELMMFQPGKAFMDSYNQGRAGNLAKIAMTDPTRRQSALADLAGLDPQAANSMKKEFDAQEQEQLKTFATAFLNTPDDLKPQMYGRAKDMWRPRFQALGSDIPDDWRQAMPTIQALAGASQEAMPADIRTNEWYLKQLGYEPGSEQARKFLQMRAGQMPKAVPYGIKYDEQGNAWLEDKNQGFIAPAPMGQAGQNSPPAEVSQGADPMASYLERIRMGGEVLAANNVPADQINAWKEEEFAKAQQELSSKGVTFAPPAGTSPQPPQQARVSVKPEAPKETYRPATPQEKAAYGIAADVPARIDSTGKVEPITVPKTGMEKTPAQIEAEQRQKTARVEMSRVLKLMLDEYKTLNETKGITSTERGVLDNIGAYARASDTGQVIGRITGSADQSARDTINQLKPQVLSAVMAASGMSAKQLDSNAEMKLWLSAVTDPQTSYQTVIKVTDNLLKKFTGHGIEQFESGGSKPPAQPPAGKRVGRFVIEEN